jgi:peptide/nickel transport system ATP-binding protein
MSALLHIHDLSVDFVSGKQVTKAVRNVSLTVNRGEVLAIVGESGSGKTVTSLSVLQLLPSPPAVFSSGQILFSETGGDAQNLLKMTGRQLTAVRGKKIAMIFQEPMSSLNPVFTCGAQIVEALMNYREGTKAVTEKEAKNHALYWFGRVQLPDPQQIFYRYPHQLSGGQKQRVMIAMAMCCHPSLLICDEPTTALDVTVQKTILQLIRNLQQEENIGVIFITHDLGVVAEVADRIAVMYKGEIVEQDTARNILLRPSQSYTKALLAGRPAGHRRGERLPVVADFMSGKKAVVESADLAPKSRRPQSKDGTPVLTVHHLSVKFPSRSNWLGQPVSFAKAVDDVSFEVFPGETLGLVGESGCGKTTLGRALLGLIPASEGEILYAGVNLRAKNKKELTTMRKDLQIVFQDPYSSLNPRLTIGAAIAEPLQVHGIVRSESRRRERVVELLEKVNLKADHFHRYPHEFSGGQRQRIVIARALALNPKFLICDESVSALDVSVQAQVLNLLNDLKNEFGFTTIFISHDLSVVRYVSDRVMVMNNGKIEEIGDAEEVYQHPSRDYTKKLINSIPKIALS